MLIGVLSDTHDEIERTRRAVAQLVVSGAKALIHCGDLTIPGVVYELAPLPSYLVFGNCDHDFDDLRQAVSTIEGTCLERGGVVDLGHKKIAITHGDSRAELKRLESQEPDYLFSGHTHKITDYRQGKTRFINPGALHRASKWTLALLDLDTDALRILKVEN